MFLSTSSGQQILMATSSALDSSINRPAVSGGVRLKYIRDASGTVLKEQWFRPPLHLAKTYHEKDWAINLLTSPTAGLLEGDRMEVSCEVGANALTALVSPAAFRVHTMGQGFATIHQSYQVAENAVLDVWPAPIVLQRKSNLKQETILKLEASSTVLLTEIISPGRANFGESFEFESWSSMLRIYRSGTLVAFENFKVNPRKGDAADWKQRFPEGPYASIYILTEVPVEDMSEHLNQLSGDDVSVGASPLRNGGLGIKVLAKDGMALRKTILQIREKLIAQTGIIFPGMLKRAQTFFY
jgi:urease accessory protein